MLCTGGLKIAIVHVDSFFSSSIKYYWYEHLFDVRSFNCRFVTPALGAIPFSFRLMCESYTIKVKPFNST